MLTLSAALLPLMRELAPLCSKPVWAHAPVLWVGALLATGTRTVTACWRVMGLRQEKCFVNSPRGLNRARWSLLAASHRLRRLLVTRFAPPGEVGFGLDDPIERRRGTNSHAKGLDRDPGRSSPAHFVTASGLRWLCCLLLAQVSWAGALGGVPCLPVLGPSERSQAERGRLQQQLPERARHSIRLLTRWVPERRLLFGGAGSFAVLALLHAVSPMPHARWLTRVRLDAEVWHPAPERPPGHQGRPRVQGARRPSPHQRLDEPNTPWPKMAGTQWSGGETREVEPDPEPWGWETSGGQPVVMRGGVVRAPHGAYAPPALLSTHLDSTPLHLLPWFVRRWRLEVTGEAARAHRGMATQRHGSDVAMARPTPVLWGLFSLVPLLADRLSARHPLPVRLAAWSTKERPTFAEALALARRCWWRRCHLSTSRPRRAVVTVPHSVLER
jgi:DDE superfamily endonuclease